MMRVVAARLWRTTPNWSSTVQLQVQLPLRWGGMGLRPMREVAPAAYLGSWALVLPTVQDLVGGAPLLGTNAPPSGTKSAVEQAEQDLGAVGYTDGLHRIPSAKIFATTINSLCS